MPLFTRCNIGLGCPQNVSEVSGQNTPLVIYYKLLFIIFGVCLKTSWFGVNANELHIPALSPEEGVECTSHLTTVRLQMLFYV